MQLTAQQQMLVEQRLANEKKSAQVAWLLWLFFVGLPAHRFYLGKTGSAVAMLLLALGGVALMFVHVGFLLGLVSGIWWLVDAFLIPGMVDQDTNSKRSRIMNEVSLTTRAEA